ncbi:two-component system, CitB family, response regulator MalR/two-component system, CitB family, response regulator DctR [Alteribacillus persepolensis]|uniref:Two-component system, CitB family, response regulator MalR/two-component system, CitB family, response regulator DctR n=1 Tax=Alteribacillus persepolensis TaxID=568899 RepID=A0A1G8EFP8_9BACI|nr:response regulator [Alteribacillus persepolensis]SDH68743.1 two-component system, CitB family, response regulator MalR/two-component system, CitB family, response regulator DctR [Alteribacillus persepolensis]
MTVRTLIVEDDPMVSSINEEYLTSVAGFIHAGTVTNGRDALNKIKLKNIDLLLLDIFMSKMDGLELLREIRRTSEKVDVIMITAADSPETIEELMRLGVVDCILKPFDFERFEKALSHYKKRASVFRRATSINQQAIDQLNNHEKKKKEVLPKGIDAITLEKVRYQLKTNKTSCTIQELASQTRVSKITMRKYLEYLSENHEIKLDLDYSTKGRPSKLYSYIG